MGSAVRDASATPLGLKEAMELVRAASSRTNTSRIGLACGFTALHLTTFVEAYASIQRPDATPNAVTGTYGDLTVALAEIATAKTDGVIVIMDWPDLDPRLSPRNAGAPASDNADLVATAQGRLGRVAARVAELAESAPVVVVSPGTEFPSYEVVRDGQSGRLELALRSAVAEFLQTLSELDNVRVVLGEHVCPGTAPLRYDARMHLRADFPFTVPYASSLAAQATRLVLPPAPKKGLITDLDDTLWRGLVGEIGPDAVSWSMEAGSQNHAMYQQLLRRLSKSGVLVGVASKNEQSVVDAALARPDLIADAGKLFPVLASWGPKSTAVGEILKAWNIGPGDVVFVDDNPLELAEIVRVFPELTTLRFSPDNPGETEALVRQLDSLFARDTRNAEDDLRVASLRSGAEFASARDETEDYGSFLADADARLEFDFANSHAQQRSYELVQKTNQFNLNGRRHTVAQWQDMGSRPGAVTVSARYADRFGDLGVISVLTGVLEGQRLLVDSWVLSCRAFSRAVEAHTLSVVADQLQVDVIAFDYEPTPRNHPVQSFLAGLGVDLDGELQQVEVDRVVADPLSNIHTVTIAGRHSRPAVSQGAEGR